MQDEHNLSSKKQTESSSTARRSFLKKAAIGAPVVIASSAKPAWATDCFSPSGIMSGNASHQEQHKIDCSTQAGGFGAPEWKKSYVGYCKDILGWSGKDERNYLGMTRNQYRAAKKKYYCRDQYTGKLSLSRMKCDDGFGNSLIKHKLASSDEFECEIAAAKLNAIQATVTGCPWKESEIDTIYMRVLDGSIDKQKATETLRKSRGA